MHKTLHILLLSRNQGYGTPDGQQIMPFFMYQRELNEQGITFSNQPTHTAEDRTASIRNALESQSPPDVVIVMPHWSEEPDELARWFDETRARIRPVRLVMLDYHAPTSSPYFGVLPYVDKYIKRQVLRDRSLYQRDYLGGFIYADFVARTWGFDLKDWHFGSKPDPEHLHKLVAGWNLGITPRYRKMLKLSKLNPIPWSRRPIDVQLRVGTINRTDKPQEWYQFSRSKALEQIQGLKGNRRLSGTGRVNSRKYFAELSLSKAVVSPFGWGEVCFRDFEAIAAGAVLVKPSMCHLETNPNIYIANLTYLSLPWDTAGSSDAIHDFLSNKHKCKEMIQKSQTALNDYYKNDRFIDTLLLCLKP